MMVHPLIGWSVARLLEHLDSAPCYLAVTGPIAAGKTRLSERLAAALGGRLVVEEPDWERLDSFYADPVRHAWPMEIEFLQKRVRLLKNAFPASATVQANRAWTVSDFWLGQSPAFAKAWLAADQWPAFVEQYAPLRGGVARPKLVVLLDAPAEELLRRVRERGRACEQQLTFEQLDRLRRAFTEQRGEPDVGPVLLARGNAPEAIFTEVLAAVRAME
jgi:deoxyadenosine/deoxycytidine kinase